MLMTVATNTLVRYYYPTILLPDLLRYMVLQGEFLLLLSYKTCWDFSSSSTYLQAWLEKKFLTVWSS